MTTLDYALAYIARGWSIVPLVPKTKRPAVKLQPYLTGEQRMTPDEATAYWKANPDHGIAIVTGDPSALAIVDVDPRNGGNASEVATVTPTTHTVRTGSGGAHYYCYLPAGDHAACGKTEKTGVDRKANGGYVVAPPSVHPCGEPYTWVGGLSAEHPAPLPEWVLRTPAPGPDDAGGEERGQWIASTIANLPDTPAGTQHETLVRLSYWLATRNEPDIARATLLAYARLMPLSRPEEPWTLAHCDELLQSAYTKLAAKGHQPGFVTHLPGGAAGSSYMALGEAEQRAAVLAKIERASTWVVQEREQWIVEGMIAPACYTEVIGEVKRGKTTLISMLMDCVLEGKDFLGRKVRKGPIVVYTEQAGLSLEKTLERAGIRNHPDLYFLTGSASFGAPWRASVGAVIDKCVEVGSQMLFVDTLARLAGVEGEAENTSGIVSILNPFQEAKARGIACTFVRHASKSIENRSDVSRAGRGSTSITGEMDICALLYKPGVEDIRCLHVVSRLGEESDQTLQYENGVYKVLADTAPAVGSKGAAEKKREQAKEAFDGGARTPSAIAKLTGMTRTTARKYLAEFMGSNMPVTFADDGEAEGAADADAGV